eukprot:719181-Alexandrium_andersonii.AAC.1
MELTTRLQSNKLDLFRLWLDQKQDFGQVRLYIERGAQKSTTARNRHKWLKERDLAKMYPDQAKLKSLIARKVNLGHWDWDPEFDGDESPVSYTHLTLPTICSV